MTKDIDKRQNLWVLSPLFGIFLFVCLYIIAALLYPGGSQADKNSKDFSWMNNYWCNLLNENAMNGEHNSARPIALTAMFILCLTLAIFWYIFPQQIGFRKSKRFAIQLSGVVSAIIGMFLFTNLHDAIINISGLCAVVAIIGTFAGLHKLKWIKLFWLGILNFFLIILNNILYYGEGLKQYLPIVQKVTFLFFLLWICLIDINLYRKNPEPVNVKDGTIPADISS
ncbi:MAG: hypothetical protein ABI834_05865 [Ginsengibacter sp.]